MEASPGSERPETQDFVREPEKAASQPEVFTAFITEHDEIGRDQLLKLLFENHNPIGGNG